MAENKTQPTKASVGDFIRAVKDPARRRDCRTVMKLMRQATGAPPRMWGPSIVGYGNYHYRYESGREGDTPQVGFSPRQRELVLYLMGGLQLHAARLKRLGKHRTGKGCLYLRSLAEVDQAVLEEMIRASVRHVRKLEAGER